MISIKKKKAESPVCTNQDSVIQQLDSTEKHSFDLKT